MRSKLKNMLTGATNEKTFRAGESLTLADMNRREAQYTYADGDTVRIVCCGLLLWVACFVVGGVVVAACWQRQCVCGSLAC